MSGEQPGDARRGVTDNDWTEPHPNNRGAAGAPGASAPGEPGYDGGATLNTFDAAGDDAVRVQEQDARKDKRAEA